jgi:hypothetical protein
LVSNPSWIKTRSVFDRYSVASKTDLVDAAAKLSAFHATTKASRLHANGYGLGKLEAPPGFEPGVEVL